MSRTISATGMSVRRVTVVLTALVMTLVACGSDDDGATPAQAAAGSDPDAWADVVAAAEEEGEVTIFSSQVQTQLDVLKQSFEEQYPNITLNIVRLDGAALISRVEADARTGNGEGDLMVSGSPEWVTVNTDLFTPPAGPSFDAAEYDRSENMPEDTYFVISAFVGAFGWNTDEFDGTIEDWPDFLDPELGDGRIGVAQPDTASKVWFYLQLQDNYGDDFLEDLAAQEPRIYPGVQPMVGALTSGEIAAATFVDPLTDEEAAGAPVMWGLGEHAWGTRFFGMVLESSPHPNAAQVLADFLVTRAGQEAIAGGGATVLPDVPGAVTTIDEIAPLDIERLTPEKLQEFQTEWDSLFQ